MDVHEFIEKHYKEIENGVIEESYAVEIFDFILEMGRSEFNSVKSQLNRLYLHLLKYNYQPAKQSASWINSIRASYKELSIMLDSEALKNKITLDVQEKEFQRARRYAANETRLPIYMFPDSLPEDFQLDKVLDDGYIEKRLVYGAVSFNVKKYLGLI